MTLWAEVPFESVYLEPSKNGINRPRSTRGSGYKMINMGELFAYSRINNPEMELVPLNDDEKQKYGVQEGDLLFARQSLVKEGAGKCSIVLSAPETTCFEGHLIRVRLDKSKVEPLFYYYYFSSHEGNGRVQSLVMQVAAAGIRGSELAKLNIPYPPIPTQRRIAGILSAYDDLIENNTRRIHTLEQMAQAIYQEWFEKFQYTGFKNTNLLGTELGLAPRDWDIVSLETVCSTITDGSHFSPPSINSGGYPMASAKDLADWDINLETTRRISENDYLKLLKANCKPLKGDVLITKDGSKYLEHIFVLQKERHLVLLSSVAILRANEKIRPHFLALYLKSPSVITRMANYVSGAAIPRIVLKDFRQFKILLPPIKLQDKFVEVIEPMMKMILTLIEKNANLRQTRDLLLPRLVSGEVEV